MDNSTKPLLQIKGISGGLLVSINEGEWLDIQQSLIEQIQEKGNFFQGAKFAIDVGNRELHAVELSTLRDRLSDFNVSLWAVLSDSPITENTAQVLGLATKISTPKSERIVRSVESTIEGENAVFVQKTVRSGLKVVSRGHIIVFGDINPGGEVIADGSVIIWGKCRGVISAGSGGDKDARVCALDLSPTQLRIAGIIAVSPKRKGKPQPEMARIVDGQVVAESWNPKAR
jgi:septum site-determining protein MinC